jgi:hypothetical protein
MTLVEHVLMPVATDDDAEIPVVSLPNPSV